jgi:hypothetical protein
MMFFASRVMDVEDGEGLEETALIVEGLEHFLLETAIGSRNASRVTGLE